ncbi:MAG: LapA family protein [Alphaproteobacteria bacterium]|nr:LapA family protein [Alphaproteobacteria bacterium]
MKFTYYIIVIPVIALLIWLLYGVETSEEGISFAPYPQDCFNPQIVLILCVAVGYVIGKLNSWFNYLPLRRDLRQQKKANKALNLEQQKLNNTVNGLKQDIAGLQEKVQSNPTVAVISEKKGIKAFFSKIMPAFGSKKGN